MAQALSHVFGRVLTAENGQAGLARYREEEIDLIITDIRMPVMDGMEMIAAIRQEDRRQKIVVLSAYREIGDLEALLHLGVDDFLPKPMEMERFVRVLTKSMEEIYALKENRRYRKRLEEMVKEGVEKSRRREKLLEHQQRHAQMGEMLSSILHQWKQPLNTIGIMVQDLLFTYQDGDLDGAYLDNLVTEVMNRLSFMAETADEFRNFFRPDLEEEPFCPLTEAKKAFAMVSKGFDHDSITVEFQGDETARVTGRKNEFAQVILNLLSNARDALNAHRPKPKLIQVMVQCQEGQCVVTVRDNAGGIPLSLLPRIFDAYVSGKGETGTGIGLWMSKAIVKKMGGEMTARNCSGGACFHLALPGSAPGSSLSPA